MRKLTATLCLTIALLIGSVGVSMGATYNILNHEIDAMYVHTIAIIAVVIVGVIITRVYVTKRAVSVAKTQLGRSLVVWAIQGPFECGAESMEAQKRAMNLIFGADKFQQYSDAILGHADSYNQRPDEWEKTRISAIAKGDLMDLELGRQLLCTIGLEKMEETLLNPALQKRANQKLEVVDSHINLRRNLDRDLDAWEKHLSNEKN